MSRVQLAINVSDVGSAVEFYRKLLQVEPAKQRPGYANFAVDTPPLKLVLIEGEGPAGSINHLGVEVDTSEEVNAAADRFEAQGLGTDVEAQTECCYALQDKVWVTDPDGSRWEVYTVLGDSEVPTPGRQEVAAESSLDQLAFAETLEFFEKLGLVSELERDEVLSVLDGALPFGDAVAAAESIHLHVKVADVDALPHDEIRARGTVPENAEPGYVRYSFPGGINMIFSSISISQDDLIEGAVTMALPHMDHIGIDLRDVSTPATRATFDAVPTVACRSGWRTVSQGSPGTPVFCCHTEVEAKHWVFPPEGWEGWRRPVEIDYGELKIHQSKMGCDLRPIDPAHPLAPQGSVCCGG